MPIANYIKPQSFVQQYLEVLPDALSATINAFVYGPHYRLSRYTDATEKADTQSKTTATGRFDATLAANETLDTTFVRVYAEALDVVVGALGPGDFCMVALATPHKIYYSADGGTTAAAIPTVDGRAIQVGDYLDLADATDGDVVRRQVTAIEDYNNGEVASGVLVLDGAPSAKYVTDSWATNLDDTFNANVVVKYTGEIASTEYAVDAAGVNIAALPEIAVAGATSSPIACTTGVGTLYLHYRALVQPSANEPVRKLTSTADINTYFGKVDPDNLLGYACSRALSGSGGKEIYATRVRTDDLTGYSEVLTKAEQNRNLYSHCPLTFDTTIQAAVATHVGAMSSWDKKRWRRAYVASDVPAGWVLFDEEPGGADYECTIDTNGVLTRTSGDINFVTGLVEADDIIRTDFDTPADATTYQQTFVIDSVLGPDTLQLKTAPGTALSGEKFEVWRGDTGQAQAGYAASRSKQLGTRRVINVWCDSGTITDTDGNTVVIDNRFLAAEIAGLRSAALPHQGLTRTEVTGVSAAPLMYTKYTDDELDVAAAAGVFIITQDLEDGAVYIRHQLTTDTDNGSLYYEDSVGTNLDDLSFGIVDIIDGYIGKFNATSDTVLAIKNRVNEYLHNKSRADRAVTIGPQVIDWDKESLSVAINAILRDQIDVNADLTLPLPLNRVIANLFGSVSFNN